LRFLRKHIWVISFLLAIIALTAVRGRMRYIPEPPPVLYQLPEYALVDHEGEPFTSDTLDGNVWVAGFIFTRCPSSCPAVTRAMLELRARFDRYGVDVHMVSVSVDPETDTPEVLATYAAQAGADNPKWKFVTGELPAIKALVGEGFRLGIGDPTPQAGSAYDIAHSTKLALVDPQGGVRGFYGIDPEGLEELFERADRVAMEAKEKERR
jgi:protein SCO1/2